MKITSLLSKNVWVVATSVLLMSLAILCAATNGNMRVYVDEAPRGIIEAVFARGSGQPVGSSPEMKGFHDGIKSKITSQNNSGWTVLVAIGVLALLAAVTVSWLWLQKRRTRKEM